MDAFELLKADHKKVAELFDRLEAANGQAKLPIFQQIKNELDVHAHIEEKIFYPALEKPEETHDLTLEAYEEHKVVKTLLAELANAAAADDEWQAKAKVLRENVEHHVKEEENELFDKADDALSDEQIESLGERMETEKAKKLGKTFRKKPATRKTPSKGTSGETGILSKIANFVGLGADKKRAPVKRRAAKKAVKKKTPASKRASGSGKATTKTAARKSGKASNKKAAKRAAGKRSSVSRGSKKAGKKSGRRR